MTQENDNKFSIQNIETTDADFRQRARAYQMDMSRAHGCCTSLYIMKGMVVKQEIGGRGSSRYCTFEVIWRGDGTTKEDAAMMVKKICDEINPKNNKEETQEEIENKEEV